MPGVCGGGVTTLQVWEGGGCQARQGAGAGAAGYVWVWVGGWVGGGTTAQVWEVGEVGDRWARVQGLSDVSGGVALLCRPPAGGW